MSKAYDDFLRRMSAYRDARNLTQTDVSKLIGKTQSQYSKMELGKTVVPYEVLEKLQNVGGWDIDYIVIGKNRFRWESSLFDYLNANFDADWQSLKEVLVWALGQHVTEENSVSGKDIDCEYKLLKRLMYQENPQTIMAEIRSITGATQMTMAEMLGVNIKKYTGLEKGTVCPDAELLALLYDISNCRPSLFFCTNPVETERHLMNDLWNEIQTERQQEIISFLEHAMKLHKL